MTNTAPTQDQRHALDALYVQLGHLKTDLNMLKRTYSNAIRHGSDRVVISDARAQYKIVADEYNTLVAQINAMTAPVRAARADEQRGRREQAQAKLRAQLRATACPTCGTRSTRVSADA